MESTVAQKLEALVKLQAIDSQLNELTKVRGALPDEVQDLEDEIAGYETKVLLRMPISDFVEMRLAERERKNWEEIGYQAG